MQNDPNGISLDARQWAASRGDTWRANMAGMEAMLAPVDEPLLAAARLDAALRIADVGCGGGGTSLALLRRAPAGSVVHGYDISPSLVEAARARIPEGQAHLAFGVADIATTTPAQPYDRLVSRFGIMFFDDPTAAFANLARWLAPDGRFAFAAWAGPSDNPWMSTVRDVVAQIVDVPRVAADAPGPFRYGDASVLTKLLEQAGLADVAVHDWKGQLAIGGGLPPAQAATFALGALSSFGELLAKAGDAAVAEARRVLTERYERAGGDVVRMDACVHVVTGGRAG